MKREIKFRAWDSETKEMSYDFLSVGWLRVSIESPYVELMQYTGLKDRNGKEIYEGDILQVNKFTFKSSWPLPETLLVKFYGGMFQLYRGDENLMGLHLMYIEDCEVIGNRWDNPDLLEG